MLRDGRAAARRRRGVSAIYASLIIAPPPDGSRWTAALPEASAWHALFVAFYALVVVAIAGYGIHRYWLSFLYYRTRRYAPVAPPAPPDDQLPVVTIQLPLFNEPAVAQRILDAACAIDYPLDKLQVQVLDDSTDHTTAIIRHRADYWRQRGLDVEVIHRVDRSGFKAGALQHGLATAKGELIAIFDADFVPPVDFLRRAVPHFQRPEVGVIQGRWEHLNRTHSLLTRAQAVFMDGHFAVEQAARCRSGRWFHFNGTAGVWRRQTIDDAGGWSATTLCEDLELSIRAQLAGWKFLYLQDVACPAELPPFVPAFKQQQHRWFKGTVQVMKLALPRVLRSNAPLRVKTELTMQLMGPLIAPLMVAFSLLYYPAIQVGITRGWPTAVGVLCVLTGIVAGTFFYMVSQHIVGRGAWYALLMLPVMIAAGMGICLSNARGVVEALLGHTSPFVRTPKFNQSAGGPTGPAPDDDDTPALPRPQPSATRAAPAPAIPWPRILWPSAEVVAGVYLVACTLLSLQTPAGRAATPLLALFAAGYLWFGLASLTPVLKTLARSTPARRVAATG